MKRKRGVTRLAEHSGAHYRICPVCAKTRVEENGLTAGDGQRWYCGEGCLNKGERLYRGRRG